MIKPIEIFGQNAGQPIDFSAASPASIFNNNLVPRIQQLEQFDEGQQLDFRPREQQRPEMVQPPPSVASLFSPQREPQMFGSLQRQQNPIIGQPMVGTEPASPDYNSAPRMDAGGDPADFIFNSEARRNSRGDLSIYQPPSGDGGGAYEIAGITARYQPQEAAKLKAMIEAGDSAGAEAYAKDFYRQRAAPFTGLTQNRGLQLQLADTVHHRGEGGLRRVLQRATGSNSRDYGTLITDLGGREDALDAFHQARQGYEWDEVDRGRDSRKKFRKGLQSRFTSAYQASLQYSQS